MNLMWLTVMLVVYLMATVYLGYRGYRSTKTAKDYLLAGRDVHPAVMALSYAATFVSTSAIVGFGGVAANLGMGLLWLTFLNILIGVIIAFLVFGKRTRLIGHNLDAHTFPELLGRRFDSPFIQGLGGAIIFLLMPLYSAAVLIGAARFLETTFPQVGFDGALLIYTLIICLYVLTGGLKGVMYTDALQGAIMVGGMVVLVVSTYAHLGGVGPAHQALTALAGQVPEALKAKGHLGWTCMPALGSPLWWTMVSTIIMGVGIGVLAQPQLAVRFMTVKSAKEINRGVIVGGLVMLMILGSAYIVGALSNVFFFNNPQFGKIALDAAGGNVDKIIPLYINSAMPVWFVYLFTLTLLSAAMSTSSSQFHAMGTAFGRDLVRAALGEPFQKFAVSLTRLGIVITVVATVALGYRLPSNIIAIATAIFFGLCACVFLPAYAGALFWPGMTKAGAVSSMVTGTVGSLLYLVFIHQKEAEALGLCQALFGKATLASYPWTVVDPVVVILPLSALVAVGVSRVTRKLPDAILDQCFRHVRGEKPKN